MHFVTTNVQGTATLLQAATEYWSALPVPERDAFRFLHVSTDEVYGSCPTAGAFPGDRSVPAELALRCEQGRFGSLRPGVAPHLRPARPW